MNSSWLKPSSKRHDRSTLCHERRCTSKARAINISELATPFCDRLSTAVHQANLDIDDDLVPAYVGVVVAFVQSTLARETNAIPITGAVIEGPGSPQRNAQESTRHPKADR